MTESRYRWFITTLTPLHIGSGERLREGFDFVSRDGALWIVQQGALFQAMLDEAFKVRTADAAQVAAEIAGMSMYQFMDNRWLRAEHFDLKRGIFAYRIPGSTSKKGRDGEVFVHIKDIQNRPYLPASSLKGALRSAVLRAVAAEDARKPEYQRGNPKTAASRMERRYFAAPHSDGSKFPNYDLWRALRLADSEPRPTESLTLGQAIVYRRPASDRTKEKGESIPLDLEVIPPGVTFTASSWVEAWLFEDRRAASELGFGAQQKEWLTGRLRAIVNEESRLRLVEETRLFMELVKSDAALKDTQRALKKLADEFASLADNEMLLPLGKGTGWRSKTLGRALEEKLTDGEFEQLVKDFNLGRGKWKRGESIPYTRLLVSAAQQRLAPMGWVKIRLEAERPR
jgi:CRISPR-associated protein Csm5